MSPCCEKFEEETARSEWWGGSIRRDRSGQWTIKSTQKDENMKGDVVRSGHPVPIDYCPFCGAELEGER